MTYRFLPFLCLCAFLALAGCKSKPGPIDNGKTDTDAQKEALEAKKYAELRKRMVTDTGEIACVNAFLASLRSAQPSDAGDQTTAFARTEVEAQYKGWPQYAAALRANEAKMGASRVFKHVPQPYRKDGFDGHFLVHTLGGVRKAENTFAYYMIKQGGAWRIDNILSELPLRIGTSAPALGMSMNQPVLAFYSYYHGAFMSKHPPTHAELRAHEMREEAPPKSWKDKRLSTDERLAYLRQACSKRFINNIVSISGGKGVLSFLNEGAKVMSQMFESPVLLATEDGPHVVELQLRPKKKGAKIKRNKLVFARAHGQWQLDEQINLR